MAIAEYEYLRMRGYIILDYFEFENEKLSKDQIREIKLWIRKACDMLYDSDRK